MTMAYYSGRMPSGKIGVSSIHILCIQMALRLPIAHINDLDVYSVFQFRDVFRMVKFILIFRQFRKMRTS